MADDAREIALREMQKNVPSAAGIRSREYVITKRKLKEQQNSASTEADAPIMGRRIVPIPDAEPLYRQDRTPFIWRFMLPDNEKKEATHQ